MEIIAPIYTAPSDTEQLRLDKPAMVGNGRFGKGVAWSTVIGAAQRLYASEVTPDKETQRIKQSAASMMMLRDQIGIESLNDTRRKADLLNKIASEYLVIEPFSMPTGGDDADVGWRISQYHCGKTEPIVLAEIYRDDLCAALEVL